MNPVLGNYEYKQDSVALYTGQEDIIIGYPEFLYGLKYRRYPKKMIILDTP